MWWYLVALAGVAALYWKLIRPRKYWLEKGVKQTNPTFLLGDNWGMVLRKQSIAEMVEMVYNMCPNTRYSGCYQFLTPTLVLKDPDLIKQITVKDFDHFVDRRAAIPEDVDPLWAKNLFALTGKRWRDMRATLSPAFTSSKIKYMFSLISRSGEQFVEYFLEKNEDTITVEMKDTFARFTNDVIANTAFGVECDSLRDKKNEFYLMGKAATDFSDFWRNVRFFVLLLIPSLFKLLHLQIFSQEVSNFFTRLVKSNIQTRQKHNVVRPDMIHLLLKAQKLGFEEEAQPKEDTGFATVQETDFGKSPKNAKVEITDVDIASQALIFFLAGFDSVSTSLCFLSYELGAHQDVQERLIQEVDDAMKACNGKLTYEAVVGMKYMDMVVTEALRKWPSAVVVDRVCTKSYVIEAKTPEEKPVHLERGDVVWLPIFGIHRDPQYYPEPGRFNPERFNEENKTKISSYTYLPFGSGPRNCIGSRFALLEMKLLFCYLLSHFKIVPVEKTQIPLVLSKKTFNLTAEGGFWFGLQRRKA